MEAETFTRNLELHIKGLQWMDKDSDSAATCLYKASDIPERREQRHIKIFCSEMYRSNSHLWIQKSIAV